MTPTLIGFALIAGMLTKREYGCDRRLDEAYRLQRIARSVGNAHDRKALKEFESRVRRVTIR